MNFVFILAVIGVVSITFTVLGFANTMTVSTNPIGADESSISTPDGYVNRVHLARTAGNFDEIQVRWRNTDSVAHTYEICALFTTSTLESTDSGDPADCILTGTLNSNSQSNYRISTSNVHNFVDDIYVTIEELS